MSSGSEKNGQRKHNRMEILVFWHRFVKILLFSIDKPTF